MTEQPASLEGHEQQVLDSLLAAVWPKAKLGDELAIDRVLKILDLKRKYRLDHRAEADEWKGS